MKHCLELSSPKTKKPWPKVLDIGQVNLRTEAFAQPAGGLSDHTLVAVREFLRAKESEIKVRIAHFDASQTALVSC